jgi:hypothetical protein
VDAQPEGCGERYTAQRIPSVSRDGDIIAQTAAKVKAACLFLIEKAAMRNYHLGSEREKPWKIRKKRGFWKTR